MRNQKWNQFAYRDEEIPETPFQACVFLNRALLHLNNRVDGPLGDTFDILIGAQREAGLEMFKEAA